MLYSDIDALCSYRGKATTDKKLHNMAATSLHRYDDGSIGVTYHDTEILRFYTDGTVRLRTDGWFTQTTARRMNDFLGTGNGLFIQVGGNPWRVTVRRKNPAHVDWRDSEPAWLPVTDAPYGENMIVDQQTGAVVSSGTMCDFAAANKATRKAIKAFIKGMTPENLADCEEDMAGALAEDVAAGRYSVELFHDMTFASRYGNPRFVYSTYVEPLLYGTAGRNGESYASMLRRDTIGYLREMLYIGPVPIRKNSGQPRNMGDPRRSA